MSPGTRSVATGYGEVEFETVECASCETEVSADEAEEFTIGDRAGHACSVCTDQGPVGFPGPSVNEAGAGLYALGAVMWPVLIPLMARRYVAGDYDEAQAESYKTAMVGTAGTALWAAAAVVVLL